MQTYLGILRHILAHGKPRSNRTGVDTLGVFGHQARFDLRVGFPILTTKKVFFRGMVEELLWFLSGDTSVKALQDKGVHIWDAWAKPDGTIGPGYGKQFRRVVHSTWTTPKKHEAPSLSEIPTTPFSKEIVVDWSHHKTKLLGVTSDTPHGPFTVIREIPPSGDETRVTFRIKFHRTGAERTVKYGDIQKGPTDYWSRTVFGVGLYGDYDVSDPHYQVLVDAWRDMIRRCYYENGKGYAAYGAVGVHVSEEWLTFANFQRDAKKLPNWFLKLDHHDDYSLDKDILFASNRYGVDTCMWASHEEQSLNTSTSRPFTGVSPEGKTVLFKSFGEASRDFGLNVSAVHRCMNGVLTKHHGWTQFKYLEMDGQVLRTRIYDQLRAMVSGIRHDPMSRRHVMTTWNPTEVEEMALPPCHGLVVQFYVQDGELSCGMYQRSCDSLLGLPWNVASYALLTHLIAHCTGLRVGELVHTFGDLHLYSNHLDQAREQLTRVPYALPQLSISADAPRDIFSFKAEHLSLSGYQHHPAIVAPVAV